MIKFAVTRPPVRKSDIMAGAKALNWTIDPVLKDFGINFETQFTKTQGCLIQNPEVEYQNGRINPGTSGRWDLRGKKFWNPNTRPLKGWGMVILENSVQRQQLAAFASQFKQIYTGHGGRIEADAQIIDCSGMSIPDAVSRAYEEVSKKSGRCDILFFILKFRNSGGYERLKKSADCRFGILTQCLQAPHVQKNSGQYHSNVCMKVNCKMGGATCRAAPTTKGARFAFFKERTMQIGVDVSHAPPGSPAASMAAMTCSADADATKFLAIAETNGKRVELISHANINQFLDALVPTFVKNTGDFPSHLYYFRDGVSEGQFAQVILQEVDAMKGWFGRQKGRVPKFTVIIATKRHHIRFFPRQGDKNGNPLPGTVVEQEVTHPRHWDFYMCSHVAIQGTARPVHYHVLMDEAGCQPAELQKMIYHQCYQYARSTTPVSLHPAVYYAHLASGRARAHENVSSEEGPRSGPKAVEIIQDRIAKGLPVPGADRPFEVEVPPLLPLGGHTSTRPENKNFIRTTMWYI
jgi:eukaryotic translation initiation factor 2C